MLHGIHITHTLSTVCVFTVSGNDNKSAYCVHSNNYDKAFLVCKLSIIAIYKFSIVC